MRIFGTLLLLLSLLSTPISVYSGSPETPDFSDDVETIKHTRKAMQDILLYVKEKHEIFPPHRISEKRLTSREQRQIIWQTWEMFLDRILVLDEIGSRYDAIFRERDDKQVKLQAYRVGYAAFLAQYRYALEFITQMENDPGMHTI